jgi:hypothetical protein
MHAVTDPFVDPRTAPPVAAPMLTAPPVDEVPEYPFPADRYAELGATDAELDLLTEAWEAMSEEQQAESTAYVAGADDDTLRTQLAEWRVAYDVEDEGAPETLNGSGAPAIDVGASTIPAVLAAVEAGTISREDALAAEQARQPAPRPTLVAKLSE